MLFPGFDWWTLLIGCAVLWMVVRTLPAAIFLLQILRYQIQEPRVEGVSQDEVPESVRALLQNSARELRREGFTGGRFVKALRLAQSSNPWSFGVILYHPDLETHAELSVSENPDDYEPVKAAFWTFFEDGPVLMTINGQDFGLLGEFPGVRIIDPYVSGIHKQWATHREELKTNPHRAARLSPEELLESVQRERGAYFELARSSGAIRPRQRSEDTYELRWGAALRMAFLLHCRVPRLKKMQAANKKRYQASGSHARVPVDIEVEAYRRALELRSAPSRRQVATGLLLLSGLAFAVSMLFYFSADLLFAVLIVLVLHEGGHYLAMRSRGYRNTRVFFIPFLGAAAKGVKDKASVWDELLVLLAGPLPGLLLGLVLSWVDWNAAAFELPVLMIEDLALLLIVINLFNLLPIYPLDGGRIVHRLFFVGRPYGEAIFSALGAAVFLFLSVLVGDFVFLVLGFFLSLAVWQMFKRAGLEKRLLQEQQELDTTSILPRLFALLADSADPPLVFPAKVANVQHLEQRLGRLKTGWAWAVAGTAAYLISIWIGLLALV